MLKNLWNDESGVIISAELALDLRNRRRSAYDACWRRRIDPLSRYPLPSFGWLTTRRLRKVRLSESVGHLTYQTSTPLLSAPLSDI